MNDQTTTPNEQTAERQPYTEPRLVEYGDLETLTKGSGNTDADNVLGSQQV
jgi:hypothetical protein